MMELIVILPLISSLLDAADTEICVPSKYKHTLLLNRSNVWASFFQHI